MSLYFDAVWISAADGDKPKLSEHLNNFLALDPGLDNWLAGIGNVGTSFIMDGKQLKALNQLRIWDINLMFHALNSAERFPTPSGGGVSKQLEEIKNQLSDFVARTERMAQTQAQTTRKNRQMILLKNSIKWNLGALISGILFIAIWKSTAWTRQRN